MRPLAGFLLLCAAAGSALGTSVPPAPGAARVRLVPHFAPDEILHYQFELHTNVTSHAVGPIEDPEGASQLEQTASVLVRLEVLSVRDEAPNSPGRVRLRATYEKSSVTSRSDALDPQEAALEEQYRKLRGRSIEFTLEPDGSIRDVTGLKEILPGAAAANMREWLAGMAFGATAPRQGIAMGEKWSLARPIEGAPLAGLAWRAESTYQRDEPCRPAFAAPSSPAGPGAAGAMQAMAAPEACAIILTRLRLLRLGARGDPTPEDFRRNGLRTSGKWSGTGESLSAISLRTGLVVSVTQTSAEDFDFTVSAATGQSRLRYAGRIRIQSVIMLLPEALP